MAPHSSTFAWQAPWMEDPDGLRSMGLLVVRHDCVTSLSHFTFTHRRRKWQPTPVFLPGESRGWGSLVGCCLWGCTEMDMTEVTQQQQQWQWEDCVQHRELSSARCGDLEVWGGREAEERGHVCMHKAESLCCAEKNQHTIVNQLYSKRKSWFFKDQQN